MTSGRPRLLRVAALALLILSPLARAELSLENLMAEFSQVTSAHGRFTERKTLGLLEIPLLLEGTLSYRAPDYLRKAVTRPEPSQFEIAGDQLTVETADGQRSFSLDDHPMLRAFSESYRALLAGDREALDRHYQTALSGSLGHWTLRLRPRDAQVGARIREITLTGSDHHILSVETLETSGDTSLMTIVPDDG